MKLPGRKGREKEGQAQEIPSWAVGDQDEGAPGGPEVPAQSPPPEQPPVPEDVPTPAVGLPDTPIGPPLPPDDIPSESALEDDGPGDEPKRRKRIGRRGEKEPTLSGAPDPKPERKKRTRTPADKGQKDLERAEKKEQQRLRKEAKKTAATKKRLSVVIIDGDRLIRVHGSAGVLQSIVIGDYPSVTEAAKAAAKASRRRRTIVVWASKGLSSRKPPPIKARTLPNEHTRVAVTAERLSGLFDNETPSSLHGQVAACLAPLDLPDRPTGEQIAEADDYESAVKAVAKVEPIAGTIQAGTNDGIWLRVGFASTDIVLVDDNEQKAHRRIGEGTNQYAARIKEEGRDAVIASMGEDISTQMRLAMNSWQSEFRSPTRAWVHGPGAFPALAEAVAGKLDLRIGRPSVSDWGWTFGEAGGDELTAITALCATESDPLVKPERTFKKIAARQRSKRLSVLLAAAAVIGAMVFWSWNTGRQRQSRLDAAEKRLEEIQREDSNRATLAANNTQIEAEQSQARLLLGLDEEGNPIPRWPNWRFGLLHPYIQETDSVTLGRLGASFTLPATAASPDPTSPIPYTGGGGIPGGWLGHLAAREAMDRFAIELFGPCATSSHGQDQYTPDRETDPSGTTGLDVSISPNLAEEGKGEECAS